MAIASEAPFTAAEASSASQARRLSAHIDGEFLDALAALAAAAGPHDDLPVEMPASGDVLGIVPLCVADDVGVAARRAREVQGEWARRSTAARAAVLLRFHDLVLAASEEILDLVQLETGKARAHALEEVLDVANQARYYAHTAWRLIGSRRRQGALLWLTSTVEHRRPRGLVGFISPWNYPLALGISDVLPALVAGNGALLKPDAQTPYAALWAVALLERAGLPHGLVQVLTGRGAELGGPILDEVDYLMFTGSTKTGRTLASMAGERLVECAMELGGKNALIVLDDADLEKTVAGAVRAVTANAGQLCVHAERIYVQAGVYDEFVGRLSEAFRALELGCGLSYGPDMGSLVSAAQLAAVQAHVDEALATGAAALAGGHSRPDIGPYVYEPTLLTGVGEGMAVYRDETFGPVASVYRCQTDDEAAALANDSEYGLNASIWTSDTRRGRELAARLETGTVNINEAYAAAWGSASPMGGLKASGMGRRHGVEGLLRYTEPQTVAVQRLLPIGVPPFLSQSQYATVMKAAVRAMRHLPGVQ